MHVVAFIPTHWLERSAWAIRSSGLPLVCFGRPLEIERRVQTRRTTDIALLLKTLLVPEAA
jgi:hypothetical protein